MWRHRESSELNPRELVIISCVRKTQNPKLKTQNAKLKTQPPRSLLQPFRVVHARFINSLVSVGTEIVALRLEQVRRQALLAIAIEVGQGRTERGNGDTGLDCER